MRTCGRVCEDIDSPRMRGARRAGCDRYYDVTPVGYSQKKNEEWKMKCTNREIEEPKNGRMKWQMT